MIEYVKECIESCVKIDDSRTAVLNQSAVGSSGRLDCSALQPGRMWHA